jgi:hypothetical protein
MDEHGQIVTENFAERSVDHRGIGLASPVLILVASCHSMDSSIFANF